MFYFYLRTAKAIVRRVLYNTEQSTFEIPSSISFKNEIKSQRSEIQPISRSKYYATYSTPFELYIEISVLDRNIKEIQFLNCNLILSDKTYDLFETSDDNLFLNKSRTWHNDQRWEGSQYTSNFRDGNKFIINNTDEYYFSGFVLGFRELSFDYNANEEINIAYEVALTDEKNSISKHTIKARFKRSYIEKGEEVSYEEWMKEDK